MTEAVLLHFIVGAVLMALVLTFPSKKVEAVKRDCPSLLVYMTLVYLVAWPIVILSALIEEMRSWRS